MVSIGHRVERTTAGRRRLPRRTPGDCPSGRAGRPPCRCCRRRCDRRGARCLADIPLGVQFDCLRTIARAVGQRAHDDVVDLRRVFNHAIFGHIADVDIEAEQSAACIVNIAPFEVRISPRSRGHFGSERLVARCHLVDMAGNLRIRQDSLFNQQLADRVLHDLVRCGRSGVMVRLKGLVVIVVVVPAVVTLEGILVVNIVEGATALRNVGISSVSHSVLTLRLNHHRRHLQLLRLSSFPRLTMSGSYNFRPLTLLPLPPMLPLQVHESC